MHEIENSSRLKREGDTLSSVQKGNMKMKCVEQRRSISYYPSL
jgi:hypothetical protein